MTELWRERDRPQRELSSICLFTTLMAATTRSGPSWRREPGTPSSVEWSKRLGHPPLISPAYKQRTGLGVWQLGLELELTGDAGALGRSLILYTTALTLTVCLFKQNYVKQSQVPTHPSFLWLCDMPDIVLNPTNKIAKMWTQILYISASGLCSLKPKEGWPEFLFLLMWKVWSLWFYCKCSNIFLLIAPHTAHSNGSDHFILNS